MFLQSKTTEKTHISQCVCGQCQGTLQITSSIGIPAEMGIIKHSFHLYNYLHLDILTSRVCKLSRFSISCTRTASYSKCLTILKNN